MKEQQNVKSYQRLGVFGGTFDPIHTGHLVTAEAVQDEYKLDKVLFIPAAQPPHKQHQQLASARQRFEMALLATVSNANFEVLSLELERPGLSYTVDTMHELLQLYGMGTEFYFITGADTIGEIHTWHHIGELLNLCHFVAATRPGCMPDMNRICHDLGKAGMEHIHRLSTPALEISSTDIRARIRQGLSIKYIVPEPVEAYIYKEGLYR